MFVKMAESRVGGTRSRCCHCAGNGSCLRCSCVTSGKHCVACYPSKKGRCLNLNPTSSAPGSHVELDTSLESGHDAVSPAEPRSELNSGFELPAYKPVATPCFAWGLLDSSEVVEMLEQIYKKVVRWKKNLFKVPTGNIGKLFIKELSRLYLAFAEGSALESVALQAAIIFPSLVLQKPHRRSKDSDHRRALESRLTHWSNGDFKELLYEGNTIQSNLKKYREKRNS